MSTKNNHYIPQLLIDNFNDTDNQVYRLNKNNGRIDKVGSKLIFKEYKMHSQDIENSCTKLENKVRSIIKGIINGQNTFSFEEFELLFVFLQVLGFHSIHRKTQYEKQNFDSRTRSISIDKLDLGVWNNDLLELCKSSTYEQIFNNPNISISLKNQIKFEHDSSYFVIIKSEKEFIMPDTMPTSVFLPVSFSEAKDLFDIFVLSPNFAIIQIYRYAENCFNKPPYSELYLQPIINKNVTIQSVKLSNRLFSEIFSLLKNSYDAKFYISAKREYLEIIK